METGGDVGGRKESLKKNSDDQVDFLCCVCTKKNKRTEAVKYCVTCEDYYCNECVQLHEVVPALSGHVLVGKSDFRGKGTRKELPSVPTERCADHPAKIVDMYCETHDHVGCTSCMATKHGESCAKLYIPENIDMLFDIETIKRSEQQLRSVIQQLDADLRLREKCLWDVLKVVDAADKQLEIYTDQIIETVTELRLQTRDQLDSVRNELESVLSKQTAVLQQNLAAAKDILQKTTSANSESNNKSQQISCSRLAAMTSKSCEDASSSLVCPDFREITFRPHKACEKLLKHLHKYQSLGEFSLLHAHVSYEILKKEATSVEVKSDKESCYIPGSFTLQDGTILLADHNNECLKRLPPHATSVSDCLQLPSYLVSVAVINQKEAAVTLPDRNQVEIISLDTTMKTTRTLKLDFVCRGIAHQNHELFISDRDTVYVYTVSGKLLRKFSRDISGQTLFSSIQSMTLTKSGRVLFVADWEKGLIAVEGESGRRLWCYTGDDLVNATGVCVDGRGGVFVCGVNSHNVLQFSENGEKIGEILSQTDEIEYPRAVCFATATCTLVVTQDDNDVVMQYQLATK